MNELLNRILLNGLEDFKGLSIRGAIPLREELVNELISRYLKTGTVENTPTPSPTPADPPINPQQLLQHLDIRELRVVFEKGVANLIIDVKR